MTALEDAREVHPVKVTVKVYVPAVIPGNVPVVPLPEIVDPPGEIVTVHVPGDGKPLRATLPVVAPHPG
jgi:hypothetical protein